MSILSVFSFSYSTSISAYEIVCWLKSMLFELGADSGVVAIGSVSASGDMGRVDGSSSEFDSSWLISSSIFEIVSFFSIFKSFSSTSVNSCVDFLSVSLPASLLIVLDLDFCLLASN